MIIGNLEIINMMRLLLPHLKISVNTQHSTFKQFVMQLGKGNLDNVKIRLVEQLFEMVNKKQINTEVMDVLIESSNIF